MPEIYFKKFKLKYVLTLLLLINWTFGTMASNQLEWSCPITTGQVEKPLENCWLNLSLDDENATLQIDFGDNSPILIMNLTRKFYNIIYL